ncbi:DUF1929 domain-containing protein [Paraburkholderia sediminicola]|uniref:galactose oxidase-like domain-containing protein n=1 Tax=Paraburkholderia sediminicola TaxID=458836 RepID=UPI0038BB684A
MPTPAGTQYKFVNQNSKLCMEVAGISLDPGAAVDQWTCNGQANQSFTLTPQNNGFAIIAAHSGLCLASASLTAQGPQITQQACNGTALQTWQISGMSVKTLPSKWTAPYNLTLVPAAANLPDGTVVAWSADSQVDFTSGEVTPGNTYTAIFNPATGTSKQVLVTNTGHDMFCPGIVNLPDGRIFVTGGSSSDKTSFYTPSTHAWSSGDLMNIPRGYEGSVTLSNGDVFLVGGSWNGGMGGKRMKAFALMRLSSVTHSVNNEQRRVPVSFTVGTAGEYLVAIPSDPGVVVPGYYMLFALNAKGVPSVSRTLLIQ